MDELSFRSRLREAVSGGRKIWPDGNQSCLLLTYDMDADSSWIMRGLDEPVARSAGQFEVNVGTPCILELMKWFGLSTTFFTPGWIAEQYPQSVTGKKPIGYRSPIWQLSQNTVRILHEAGFKYTSDFMHTLLPTWNEVNGKIIDMINLPGSWPLDDAVYFQFHITIRTAMRRAADVLEIYKEEFRAVHAVGGLFTLVMHPQLSGRPSRVLMLKEFIDYVKGFEGVWLPRPIDVVEYWRSEHKNFGPRLNSANLQTT
jgi:peptidoglycan/xylan/chitin deacetylase (PgdA/CDA1 family)